MNLANATKLVVEYHRRYPKKSNPSSCIATHGTHCQKKMDNVMSIYQNFKIMIEI